MVSTRLLKNDYERKMKDQLLLQLHEQYAINNNANLSSVVAIVVALIAVIGIYGYVFVRSTLSFSNCLDILYNKNTELYTMDVLCFAFLSSITVIAIMACFCIYQGVAQRKEQFIIYAIRKKNNLETNTNNLLPKQYNPYAKKGLEIIQGLYGELVYAFIFVAILIVLSFIAKLICNYINGLDSFSCTGVIEVTIIVAILLVVLCCVYYYFNLLVMSYIKRQIEYIKKDIVPVNFLTCLEELRKLDTNTNNCCIFKMCEKKKYIKKYYRIINMAKTH